MKKHLFFAATAALALASCSSDSVDFTQADVLQAQDDNSVQFDTYMGKVASTRADYEKGAITNGEPSEDNSLKNAKFGVFAYQTTSDYVNTTPTTSLRPNFMYNQEITWHASAPEAWVYTPVKYWPNGNDAANAVNDPSNNALQDATYAKKLSFFAYAPYKLISFFDNTTYTGNVPASVTTADVQENSSVGVVNGIKAMTKNTYTGNVWLKYLMPTANEKEAVDLLWGTNGKTTYTETDGANPSLPAIGTGYNMNLTKQTVGEKVKFLFKHALAKLGGSTVTTTENLNEASSKCDFMVKVDVDNNYGSSQTDYFAVDFDKTKTLVTVKNVLIEDAETAHTRDTRIAETTSDLFKNGWFNIETGTWDMTGAEKGGTLNITVQNSAENKTNNIYTLNPQIKEIGVGGSGQKAAPTGTPFSWNSTEPTGVTVAALPLYANENAPAIMLIPGNADQTIYVTVDYFVRTADANLSTGYSEVEQIITNKVVLPHDLLKSNNVYKIIMHLGLTSVKFEAVVSDWQTKENSSFNTDGTETGGDALNDRNVWLPSNVVSTASSITVANQSNATANVAKAANASYQIKVTGMAANAAYTVTSSDDTNAHVTAGSPANASGVATITVNLTENAGSARSFVIKVTETATGKVTKITINQAAA